MHLELGLGVDAHEQVPHRRGGGATRRRRIASPAPLHPLKRVSVPGFKNTANRLRPLRARGNRKLEQLSTDFRECGSIQIGAERPVEHSEICFPSLSSIRKRPDEKLVSLPRRAFGNINRRLQERRRQGSIGPQYIATIPGKCP